MAQGGGWARRRAGDRSDAGGARAGELRVVSGDGYADWQAVYEDNVDRIYRLMFSKVGNRVDAEDLTAEVFLAALRPLRVSASVGEVRAYLLTTARTVLAGHWRATMGREITTIDEDYADPQRPEVTVSDAPQRAEAVLSGLPERYRRILTLRFLNSYSVKDAAAALGVSVANAKVLQHRALRRAAELGEEGPA
ncbi:RNA polymerase sigma factor [Pseudonocardia sp. GCM10023141]|uniref:RNA polymerase sigma factor n=1 Tax=Pseudonocardia sp. GCM10023141 TaxID=3252653 RepID=UPI0036141121